MTIPTEVLPTSLQELGSFITALATFLSAATAAIKAIRKPGKRKR